MKSIFLSTLSVLLLAACAQNPATGKRDFMLLSEESEFESGEDVAEDAIKEYGLYEEKPELTKYYRELADKLVNVTERSDKPFEFIILDNEQLNAWATPGYINMYRGILPLFNSEAEFLAVMAHEAGHITARHSARTQSGAIVTNVLLGIGAIALAQYTDNDTITQAGIAAGAVAANVGFAKYSRKHEDEADGLALRYMEEMGYDAREAADVYKMFERYHKLNDKIYAYENGGEVRPQSPFYDLLDSHPNPADRVHMVYVRVGEGPILNQNQDKYYQMINGIAFGPNFKKFGMVGEGYYANQNTRFKMKYPVSFYVAHTGGVWQAVDKASGVKFQISSHELEEDKSIEELMRTAFTKAGDFSTETIGGLSVTKAAYKASGNTFKYYGIKHEKKASFVVFTLPNDKLDAAEKQVRSIVSSFTKLTASQAKALQPLRVKIHTVKSGETASKLSSQMPLGKFSEDWFSVMNAIEDGDGLKIGQKVKLVVDPNAK